MSDVQPFPKLPVRIKLDCMADAALEATCPSSCWPNCRQGSQSLKQSRQPGVFIRPGLWLNQATLLELKLRIVKGVIHVVQFPGNSMLQHSVVQVGYADHVLHLDCFRVHLRPASYREGPAFYEDRLPFQAQSSIRYRRVLVDCQSRFGFRHVQHFSHAACSSVPVPTGSFESLVGYVSSNLDLFHLSGGGYCFLLAFDFSAIVFNHLSRRSLAIYVMNHQRIILIFEVQVAALQISHTLRHYYDVFGVDVFN